MRPLLFYELLSGDLEESEKDGVRPGFDDYSKTPIIDLRKDLIRKENEAANLLVQISNLISAEQNGSSANH